MLDILQKAVSAARSLGLNDLIGLLSCEDEGVWPDVYAAAREVKGKVGRVETLPRGLIECSNICAKDCLYCGIRKSNDKVARYKMSEREVLSCCDEARKLGYGAIALQAGEIECEENTAFYERILASCRDLEVTLSLGEQTESVYRRWKEAGALRYLLRIETSNRALYEAIHPADCSFNRRIDCIRTLKKLGYITGTGVMIGLPGQSIADLARDIMFFAQERVDMVGMGPFVPHEATPLGALPCASAAHRVELALRMIALTRLQLHDVNIVAASALDALDAAHGRLRAIEAGANVIMPDLTPAERRAAYDLYPGKAHAL